MMYHMRLVANSVPVKDTDMSMGNRAITPTAIDVVIRGGDLASIEVIARLMKDGLDTGLNIGGDWAGIGTGHFLNRSVTFAG